MEDLAQKYVISSQRNPNGKSNGKMLQLNELSKLDSDLNLNRTSAHCDSRDNVERNHNSEIAEEGNQRLVLELLVCILFVFHSLEDLSLH